MRRVWRARSASCCAARGCTRRTSRSWRRERDAGELAGLAPRKRGRKASKNALAEEIARLERENAKLQHELHKANTIIDVQKKLASLFGTTLPEPTEEDFARGPDDLRAEAPVMQGLVFLIPLVGIVAACVALGVNRASYYRAQKPKPPMKPRPRPARALGEDERAHVLAVLDSDPFMDKAPAQVYAKLLEDGEYLCSTRTMYRVLDDASQVRERRAQRRHPEYVKPQLVATAPNQVWSWDTTKLPGPVKGTYYTLYVILDIFSRYVVGWQVAKSESAKIAQRAHRGVLRAAAASCAVSSRSTRTAARR